MCQLPSSKSFQAGLVQNRRLAAYFLFLVPCKADRTAKMFVSVNKKIIFYVFFISVRCNFTLVSDP
jgi:hypothetical protein